MSQHWNEKASGVISIYPITMEKTNTDITLDPAKNSREDLKQESESKPTYKETSVPEARFWILCLG